jgi:CTP:molybdopterin cytidylyltransferase MocA
LKTVQTKFHAVILAAGASSRLGKPKFSLAYDKKRNFIEKCINEYMGFGCQQIVVVIRPDDIPYFDELTRKYPANLYISVNHDPERGRLSSVQTGLQYLDKVLPVFIQNIDNPFVNKIILNRLAQNLDTSDAIYPAVGDQGGHPLLLSEKLVAEILTLPHTSDFKAFIRSAEISKLQETDSKILVNINTQEDYLKWFDSAN